MHLHDLGQAAGGAQALSMIILLSVLTVIALAVASLAIAIKFSA